MFHKLTLWFSSWKKVDRHIHLDEVLAWFWGATGCITLEKDSSNAGNIFGAEIETTI